MKKILCTGVKIVLTFVGLLLLLFVLFYLITMVEYRVAETSSRAYHVWRTA